MIVVVEVKPTSQESAYHTFCSMFGRSSVWTAVKAIANAAGAVMLPHSLGRGLLRMNESIHGERTASEPQDQVTELIEQQTVISEVLRAIANSPHDL